MAERSAKRTKRSKRKQGTKRTKGTQRGARRRGASGTTLEWIGGRLTSPFFIEDADAPYRAELVLWLEAPSGLIVGQELSTPEQAAGAVGRVLKGSLARPSVGSPRRPDRIRVASPALAAEVREAIGEAIPVRVAPTPELDDVLAQMAEAFAEDEDEAEASYLDDGRIPEPVVARLFTAAVALYAVKPWQTATDDRVLRMDVPALGVEGACISIVGYLGESLGVLVFPSLAGYLAFGAAAARLSPGPPELGAFDLGTAWLSLGFERGADLPAALRREVATHGWPVADANAYPWLDHRERDGAQRPLTARDFALATACARALTGFFLKHEQRFAVDDPEPVCESWFDEDDLEVRLTLPYEAFDQFEPVSASAGDGRPRRNDPCPCGSGRKYKKCCLRQVEQTRADRAAREGEHALDGRLAGALLRFAEQRFGPTWWGFERDFAEEEAVEQLLVPWGLYHHRVEGETTCEHFLAERGASLAPAERRWLTAQQAAWLSVWEVASVAPGEGLVLHDLLSGETRHVREATASQTLVVRDAVLGRVVEGETGPLLCGMYPRVLPPLHAAEVVRRARGRLRRRREVPVERLRDEAFTRYLIRRWEEAVEDLDAERAIPTQLANTDGDPFLLTTDHFAVAPGEADAVGGSLSALPGAEPPDPDEVPAVWVFLREGNPRHASWENTIVGRAVLDGAVLRLETNSRERADALRAAVEAACGARIRHRAREHSDPLSEQVQAASSKKPGARSGAFDGPPPPEAVALLRDLKRRHYADWLDQSIPALSGRTPREAVRSAAGRDAVDALLKDMENHEQRLADGAAFDFAELRRELGLA